jgi:DNA ligase-1
VLLDDIAQTSAGVAATGSRTAKIELIADLLRGIDAAAAGVVVAWLAGDLPQRQIGVGWSALRELPPPASSSALTVSAVDDAFSAIKASTGAGSQAARRRLLDLVFGSATRVEQDFLRALLSGELRQGALQGVMTAAIARAADVGLDQVRRAAMLRGDLPAVARAALEGGAPALAGFRLEVGRPISPMLAQSATGVGPALSRLGGRAALEAKLDGFRIQVHRSGDDVAIFTRSLDDVTARMPEVVALARSLPATSFVLDGEALVVRPDGRPAPFQLTSARAASAKSAPTTALAAYFFDVLHLDGEDLLDAPAARRAEELARLVPAGNRVARLVTDDMGAAERFSAEVLRAGHEGVVVKALAAPYEAGRRGDGWLKVKPVHTLDLVVIAVEHGSGRRTGLLSNIHLGARGPDGGFIMLGKTFKGMTDELLTWQTARFTELADGTTDGWVVRVRPEQVVEIAFDGVQRSSRYPGGVALRFARVVRYREDKSAAEADSIDTVRDLLPA